MGWSCPKQGGLEKSDLLRTALLNIDCTIAPINLSMSTTFVNLDGLPIRIARIRSI